MIRQCLSLQLCEYVVYSWSKRRTHIRLMHNYSFIEHLLHASTITCTHVVNREWIWCHFVVFEVGWWTVTNAHFKSILVCISSLSLYLKLKSLSASTLPHWRTVSKANNWYCELHELHEGRNRITVISRLGIKSYSLTNYHYYSTTRVCVDAGLRLMPDLTH